MVMIVVAPNVLYYFLYLFILYFMYSYSLTEAFSLSVHDKYSQKFICFYKFHISLLSCIIRNRLQLADAIEL